MAEDSLEETNSDEYITVDGKNGKVKRANRREGEGRWRQRSLRVGRRMSEGADWERGGHVHD